MWAQEISVFCVVAVVVVGWLRIQVLVLGLGLASVDSGWCVVGKGLHGVYFVGTRAEELGLETV